MPYCSKCGVKIETKIESCPLCDYPLAKIPEEKLKEERYPIQQNVFSHIAKRRRNVFLAIYSCIVLAVCLNLNFIDYSNGSFSWSIYVNLYLLGSIIYFMVFLGYFRSLITSMIVAALNTCIILLITDALNGNISWSVKLAFPIVLEAAIYIYFSIIMFKSKIILPYRIMNFLFFTSVFLINLEILINHYLYGVIRISWSAYAVIFFIPLILIIIFIPRKKYEALGDFLERKFHL